MQYWALDTLFSLLLHTVVVRHIDLPMAGLGDLRARKLGFGAVGGAGFLLMFTGTFAPTGTRSASLDFHLGWPPFLTRGAVGFRCRSSEPLKNSGEPPLGEGDIGDRGDLGRTGGGVLFLLLVSTVAYTGIWALSAVS